MSLWHHFVAINVVMLLLKASRKEQRSVIHFLLSKGLCPNAIHSEMRSEYQQ